MSLVKVSVRHQTARKSRVRHWIKNQMNRAIRRMGHLDPESPTKLGRKGYWN